MHRFFYGLLFLQGIFYQNFKKFSQLARPVAKVSVQPEFIGAYMNSEHLGLFRSYLPHPNSESRTVFFIDSLFFKEYSLKISNFFSTDSICWQPVHWASLYRALILAILEPKSYMAQAHKLHIGLRKYFGPWFEFLATHHESIWILGGEARE